MSEFFDKKSPIIVLCYAREDIEKVKDIYDRLKQAGFNLWFDVADILGGQNPDIELRKVISKSNCVLIFLTKSSVHKHGVIHKCIRYASECQKEIQEDAVFTIPVKLEEIEESEMPDSLSKLRSIDLYISDGFAKLLNTLKLKFGSDTYEQQKILRDRIENYFKIRSNLIVLDGFPTVEKKFTDDLKEKYAVFSITFQGLDDLKQLDVFVYELSVQLTKSDTLTYDKFRGKSAMELKTEFGKYWNQICAQSAKHPVVIFNETGCLLKASEQVINFLDNFVRHSEGTFIWGVPQSDHHQGIEMLFYKGINFKLGTMRK